MKFIVSSTALLKRLQSIGGVLNSSNTLPILDNFLFDINEKELTISASDLETTMTTTLDIEAKETGSVAIPAKLLMDILKTFPDHPLTFLIDDETYAIEIASDYGKYKLSGFNSDEFPKVPVLEDPSSVSINAKILFRAIEKSIFAAGNDELRPVMSGVFFQLESDSVTFVATDAHKLVRYRRNDLHADKPAAFIVPRKPMTLIKNLLNNSEEDVLIQYNESNAMFEFGNFKLVCRLIDGKYPNYEAVIPNENPNRMTIDRKSLLNSIKRVSIFANKTTHQVRLKISNSKLILNSEDLDFANAASERLTCSYEGDEMEIGFNSRFMLEMLNNIDTETVVLELSAPNRAGILLPENPEDEGEDILMLVMPVMLNH